MLKSNVLLPSDGSEHSLKAAAYAAMLMKRNPDMNVTVLVVVPASADLAGIKDDEKELLMKYENSLMEKGKEILDMTASVFISEGLKVNRVLEKGDPAGIIIEHSRQGHYDHIIMGSRGVSELRGLALGSVSHKVINLADCRVTLVK